MGFLNVFRGGKSVSLGTDSRMSNFGVRSSRMGNSEDSAMRQELLMTLHQICKSNLLREFAREYELLSMEKGGYVLIVHMKNLDGISEAQLMARWHLVHMQIIKFARMRSIPLKTVACNIPEDQSTPVRTLETRAFSSRMNGNSASKSGGNTRPAPLMAAPAPSPTPAPAAAPRPRSEAEEQFHQDIAVQEHHDMSAEEFFAMSQTPAGKSPRAA